MEGFAIVPRGMEELSAKEIASLIATKPKKTKDGIVTFPIKTHKDLCKLSYLSQATNRILYHITDFKFKDMEDLEQHAKNIDYSEFIKKDTKFAVRCKHITEVPSGREVEDIVGRHINGKVNLNKPAVKVIVYICDDRCYVGIDFSGNISKREYRIFIHASALAGPVAFNLLLFSDYKSGNILLDPFTGSGTIPIEASLYASKFSPHHFSKDKFPFLKFVKDVDEDYLEELDKQSAVPDKQNIYGYDHLLRHVTAAKKNAKIAGILKAVYFSKVSVEWLDAKFKKEEIDTIVSQPPQLSKHTNPKDIEKIYNEFFYQCKYVLNKTGAVVLIMHSKYLITKMAEKHDFILDKEIECYQGKQMLFALKFKKA